MADLNAPGLHDFEEVKGGLDEHGPGLQITPHEIHKGLLHTLPLSEAVHTQDVMTCPLKVQNNRVGLNIVDAMASIAKDITASHTLTPQ